MSILFSVVLSVAKDLIAARYRHEILRFAQDDGGAHARPATRFSRWPISISLAEIAETPMTCRYVRRARGPAVQ
jgi:hypothetical protein